MQGWGKKFDMGNGWHQGKRKTLLGHEKSQKLEKEGSFSSVCDERYGLFLQHREGFAGGK